MLLLFLHQLSFFIALQLHIHILCLLHVLDTTSFFFPIPHFVQLQVHFSFSDWWVYSCRVFSFQTCVPSFIFSCLYSSLLHHISSLLKPLLLHQVCIFLYYHVIHKCLILDGIISYYFYLYKTMIVQYKITQVKN